MTTGNQIAITFEVSIHFASNLAPFLLMVTFYKNVIIFLIGIFFGYHVTKNGGFFKIKKLQKLSLRIHKNKFLKYILHIIEICYSII